MLLKRFPFEGLIWFTGLFLLYLVPGGETHFTLCPLKNAGFDFCPGCGLGASISLFLHGQVLDSLRTHPLGIFAVIILSFRIVNLTKLYLKNYGKSY